MSQRPLPSLKSKIVRLEESKNTALTAKEQEEINLGIQPPIVVTTESKKIERDFKISQLNIANIFKRSELKPNLQSARSNSC